MLYVFLVDTGTMLQFDMNYALESVAQLGEAIEKVTRIPVSKQVLLVSGGESLDSTARVCSYSAGTDTNPIFLFSRCNIENVTPPSPSVNYGSDQDLKEQVEATSGMEPNYNSVVVRTQLAQQFWELAREQIHVCEGLVHDQHLMQQGWAAVVANLEDVVTNFHNLLANFKSSVGGFLQNRDEYLALLGSYKEVIGVLAKVPMIPDLLQDWADLTLSCASSGRSSKEGSLQPGEGEGKSGSEEDAKEGKQDIAKVADSDGSGDRQQYKTLLEWIDIQDKQFSIDKVADLCSRVVSQINNESYEELTKEGDKLVEAGAKLELKEIKGLEERLCGLEQLMYEARRLMQEQRDIALSFMQNQKRVSNFHDPSIFPDLCTSHQGQLKVMLDNHHRLLDICHRCAKAKAELSANLYHRVRWVGYAENRIMKYSTTMMLSVQNTKRLTLTLDVVRQVHKSPELYLKAVGEVVRRRAFSQAFLMWASDLACRLLAIHNEEVSRRRDFQQEFDGHFLNSLFTGINDMPPPFATQPPPSFDCHLPKLTMDHMQRLMEALPEMSTHVSLPEIDTISSFFLSVPVPGERKEVTEKLVEVEVPSGTSEPPSLQSVGAEGSLSKLCPIAIQTPAPPKELDRGFESETDTEEFEKVGQSPVKLTSAEADGGAPACGQASSAVALLEVGVLPEVRKAQATPSPSSSYSASQGRDLSSANPSHPQLPPEFATTEYYIDDSMPSSYTESSGAGGGRQGGGAGGPTELQRQLEDAQALATLLQENLGNMRSEVEHLRGILGMWGESGRALAKALRQELAALRLLTTGKNEMLSSQAQEVLLVIEQHCNKMAQEEATRQAEAQQVVQQLTLEHELELDALKQEVKGTSEVKDDEIRQLKQELESRANALLGLRSDMEHRLEEEVAARDQVTCDLEARIADLRNQVGQMQRQLDAAEAEKQRAVQDVREQLQREYKTEMENLRSRFRLMATASMERSPSDSSLEKIERADLIELVNHEAILQQLREDFEEQHELVVKAAVENERALCEAKLEEELKMARSRSEADKQVWFNDAIRRVVEDKDKQIEALRLRETSLVAENQRYQETIRNLTDGREAGRSLDSKLSGSTVWMLLDRIEVLRTEKCRLEAELERERFRKVRTLSETAVSDGGEEQKGAVGGQEMSASVAVVQESGGSRDVATSPEPAHRGLQEERIRDKLTQSTTSLIQQGRISLVSCNIGDAVLVVWDEEHKHYTILQESATLYFLHSDCLDSLGLRPPCDDSPRMLYSTGEVLEKEYCHAKKPENRYRVPKGTKFYRVKVRPLHKESLLRSHHHYLKQKQQQQQHYQRHHHSQQLQLLQQQEREPQEKQSLEKQGSEHVSLQAEIDHSQVQKQKEPQESNDETKTTKQQPGQSHTDHKEEPLQKEEPHEPAQEQQTADMKESASSTSSYVVTAK